MGTKREHRYHEGTILHAVLHGDPCVNVHRTGQIYSKMIVKIVILCNQQVNHTVTVFLCVE